MKLRRVRRAENGCGVRYALPLASATTLLIACGGSAAMLRQDGGTAPKTTTTTREGRALLDAVRARGSLPVIVTLAMPFTPESRFDPEQAKRQRAAIRRHQDKLIAALPAGDFTVSTRFVIAPQLALVVREAALRYLLTSQLVARVQADRPEPAAGP